MMADRAFERTGLFDLFGAALLLVQSVLGGLAQRRNSASSERLERCEGQARGTMMMS